MKPIKSSRANSFLCLVFVYLFAIAIGVVCYRLLPFHFAVNLLLSDIAATGIVFIGSLIFHNASVYDPYWSVQPMVIAVGLLFTGCIAAEQILLVCAVCLWGIRLTANWAYTFHGLDHQDWRYTMLQQSTGQWYPLVNFFGIHLVPTLIVYGCVLPVAFAFYSRMRPINGFFIAFVLLAVGSAVLQGAADVQMHQFRRQNSGALCRVGLWKYSRHPNYLGEIMMWWNIALACLSIMPERWYLLYGAAANTILFVFISIPMADRRQSAKAGYDLYEQKTRSLLPIPKF